MAVKKSCPILNLKWVSAFFSRTNTAPENLLDLYNRFSTGDGAFDMLMRRAIWRAVGTPLRERGFDSQRGRL